MFYSKVTHRKTNWKLKRTLSDPLVSSFFLCYFACLDHQLKKEASPSSSQSLKHFDQSLNVNVNKTGMI